MILVAIERQGSRWSDQARRACREGSRRCTGVEEHAVSQDRVAEEIINGVWRDEHQVRKRVTIEICGRKWATGGTCLNTRVVGDAPAEQARRGLRRRNRSVVQENGHPPVRGLEGGRHIAVGSSREVVEAISVEVVDQHIDDHR